MIVLFAIDLEHQILPNVITLPGIVVGFVFSLFLPPGGESSLIGAAGRRRLFSLLIARGLLPHPRAAKGWAWAT